MILNARYDVSHTNLTKLINLDAFRKIITFEKRLLMGNLNINVYLN